MTSEWLLNTCIEGLYLSKKFYPQNKFLAKPLACNKNLWSCLRSFFNNNWAGRDRQTRMTFRAWEHCTPIFVGLEPPMKTVHACSKWRLLYNIFRNEIITQIQKLKCEQVAMSLSQCKTSARIAGGRGWGLNPLAHWSKFQPLWKPLAHWRWMVSFLLSHVHRQPHTMHPMRTGFWQFLVINKIFSA